MTRCLPDASLVANDCAPHGFLFVRGRIEMWGVKLTDFLKSVRSMEVEGAGGI